MTTKQNIDEKAAAEFRRKGDIYVLFNRTPTKDALLNEIREGHLIDKIIDYAFTAGMLHERKKHEWVSVKERLPMDENWYYCFFTTENLNNPIRLAHFNPDRKKFECAFMSKVIEDDCTHWFPLPNPPQELEEK